MAITLNATLRNARSTAIVTEAGSGALIKLYTSAYGTLLGTLTCSSTLGTVSGGVMTANAITDDSSADASGTFALARLYKADGVTMVMEGLTVGTSGTDIIVNAASSTAGAAISMTSFTITEANA